MNCNHVFPYWSVVPPSHCPHCGGCLHPVHVGPPVNPWPQPWHPRPWGPFYTTTVSTGSQTVPPLAPGTVCSA